MQRTEDVLRALGGTLAKRPSALARRPAARINVHGSERLASALAGGLALAWGLAGRSTMSKAAALVGSGLVYRGVSGHCHLYEALGVNTAEVDAATPVPRIGAPHPTHYDVRRSVTIQKSPEEVYRHWKQSDIFARTMHHFATLEAGESGRTRWTIHDPLGAAHSWETEVVEDRPGELIRWATRADSPLVKSVSVMLKPAPGERGTEVILQIRLEPPAGVLGRALKGVVGKVPSALAERALFNFKSLIETGELPSLRRNPAARSDAEV